MENKINLKVGDIVIAKENMYNNAIKLKYEKGKKYEITSIDNNTFYTRSEINEKIGFRLEDFDKYFEIINKTLSNDEFVEKLAYKEKEGKLFYELDFDFITQMAEKMNANKGKYERYNWKKLDNVEDLKQALFRHVIAIMKGEHEDDGREFGHLESAACNLMMINYQLKH